MLLSSGRAAVSSSPHHRCTWLFRRIVIRDSRKARIGEFHLGQSGLPENSGLNFIPWKKRDISKKKSPYVPDGGCDPVPYGFSCWVATVQVSDGHCAFWGMQLSELDTSDVDAPVIQLRLRTPCWENHCCCNVVRAQCGVLTTYNLQPTTYNVHVLFYHNRRLLSSLNLQATVILRLPSSQLHPGDLCSQQPVWPS